MEPLQPMVATLFVLALLAGALFALRKKGAAAFRIPRLPSGGGRRLETVERLALGPQHALHLIRIDGRCVLVATAPTSVQLLRSETEITL
jgi:flagellar biogenesis protein FliO